MNTPPFFGTWQPIETVPVYQMVLGYFKGKGTWVHEFNSVSESQGATHWMPLPPPPVEEWKEAFEEWGIGYDGSNIHKLQRDAFKAGFEAGRKK